MVKSTSGVPRGYQAVMPYLRVRDAAAAVKFYKRVFGAAENFRIKMPGGKIGHVELNVAGAVVMISDEFPDIKAVGPATLKGSSVMLTIYVENVDKVFAKAIRAGAKLRQQPSDQFYGDRTSQIVDPFGHIWSINTRIKKVAAKDMQKLFDAMLHGEAMASAVKPRQAKAAKSGGRKSAGAAKKSRASSGKAAPKASVGRSKSAAKTAVTRKAAAKKTSVGKASARKTPAARKAPAQKVAANKAPARKGASPAKVVPARKRVGAKSARSR